LLVDDGELDRISRMLDLLGVAYEHCSGRGAGKGLPRPSELLVTSGRVALALPSFVPPLGPDGPIWVCYHGQDFLPLRDQLRSLGAHYLVNASVRQDSLRLFLLQLLRRDANRRRADRLPLGLRAQCWFGSQLVEALLVDLSPLACRVVLDRKLAPGTLARVVLPAGLAKGVRAELPGQVRRSLPAPAGQPSWSTVIFFDALPPEDGALIERILAGAAVGTPVSRLAEPRARERRLDIGDVLATWREETGATRSTRPGARAEPPAEAEAPTAAPAAATRAAQAAASAAPTPPVSAPKAEERREQQRRAYSRKVAVLELSEHDSEGLALGCDLSNDGVRLTGCLPLEPGMKVTLALYAGRREEPAVVEAVVLRKEAEGEFALRFCDPSPRQRKEIAALVAALPALQAVSGASGSAAPIAVARVIDAA
jgi:hypothetical protein